ELALQHGEPCLGVVHRLIAGGPITLAVEPLCTGRDAHAERYERDGLAVEHLADGAIVEGAYRIVGPGFEPAADWFEGAFHRHERDRGLAATEDLVRVGTFSKVLQNGEALEVGAWSGDLARPPQPASVIVDQARRRIRSLAAGANSEDEAVLRQ